MACRKCDASQWSARLANALLAEAYCLIIAAAEGDEARALSESVDPQTLALIREKVNDHMNQLLTQARNGG